MPRITSSISIRHPHPHGTLTIDVRMPDSSGYVDWEIELLGYRYGGGTMMRDGTNIVTALVNLLSDLSDDCELSPEEVERADHGDLRCGDKDLVRTLLQHGMGDVPTELFIAYGRDVVPSA